MATVAELMENKTPNPDYAGVVTADNMIFAVDLADPAAADPTGYIVAEAGITEITGALEAQNTDSNYLRQGLVTTKTGTSRSFSISGDRFQADTFQDAVLAHDMKFGAGQTVVKKYVYFNYLTGMGEQGTVSIAVEDDYSGAAGENASFTITCSSTGTPTEYTYPPTP